MAGCTALQHTAAADPLQSRAGTPRGLVMHSCCGLTCESGSHPALNRSGRVLPSSSVMAVEQAPEVAAASVSVPKGLLPLGETLLRSASGCDPGSFQTAASVLGLAGL